MPCSGAPVTVAFDPDVPVRLDPRLTATALAHLLENAAQYTPAGSTIDVVARVVDDELTIQVRDHGPGIAPADLPHLFDRFYRGAAAKDPGVGHGHGPVDCAGGCWPPSRDGSGRRTAPTAAPSSRSRCRSP